MLIRVDEADVAEFVTGQAAQRITRLQRLHGLDDAAMADFLGVSRMTYWNYRTGRHMPSLMAVWRLAVTFGVGWDEVMPERALVMRGVSCGGPEDEADDAGADSPACECNGELI